ncbi:MAG: DUF1801 domain-containing protein [Crocinitomicaceae bacterium]|nr:DUF1801 domain-containing protein [Crocinitomicaceae bacterium]
MKKKPTFDEYIEQAETFAQPILHFIRECMHEAHPSLKEEIKWNFPNFIYNGAILAHMAGFKKHATLGFWMSSEMKDPQGVFVRGENKGMGDFGKITSLEELPNKEVLISYIREAIVLHDLGVKISPSVNKKSILDNLDLIEALKSNEQALLNFTNFSPSQKAEYHEWANDAKTEAPRNRRILQALQWISEGKPRNWKYMKSWKGKV